jgi:hypothetical protein
MQFSLSEGLIAANYRRISYVAIYASMLLVRAAWLELHTPLLVVIQRFCSHGGRLIYSRLQEIFVNSHHFFDMPEFHNIYCRIVSNPTQQTSSIASPFYDMGEPGWFNVTLVSAQDIFASTWTRLPHIIMMCMSGEGTIEDFRRLHLENNQGNLCPSQPHNGRCKEINSYASTVEQVNFARFITHYAAQHGQFPSNLPGLEDGFDRVSELMQKSLGKKASDVFKEARDGADDFGTGRSTSMFTIEHIFLEFPGLVLTELKEKPAVYGCKLES